MDTQRCVHHVVWSFSSSQYLLNLLSQPHKNQALCKHYQPVPPILNSNWENDRRIHLIKFPLRVCDIFCLKFLPQSMLSQMSNMVVLVQHVYVSAMMICSSHRPLRGALLASQPLNSTGRKWKMLLNTIWLTGRTVEHKNYCIFIFPHRAKCLKFFQWACLIPEFIPTNLYHTWKTERMTCSVFGCFDQFTGFDLQHNGMFRIIPKVGIRIGPFNATGWTAVYQNATILCYTEHVLMSF